MTTSSSQTSIIMANLSHQTVSYFLLLAILLQGSTLIAAQAKQYESVLGSNNQPARTSSISSTVANLDDTAYEGGGSDIYDDTEDFDDASPTSTTAVSQSKYPLNKTSPVPAQTEEISKNDYEDESDPYQNEENPDDDSSHPDSSNVFGEGIPSTRPDIKLPTGDGNQKKGLDSPPTSRLPLVPSTLWRELFTKPGILVGIIGGVVIGMLSAILLVMFIIYRMRKKDEGSYALEEGPRKSPSHAYTRVSSREFFA